MLQIQRIKVGIEVRIFGPTVSWNKKRGRGWRHDAVQLHYPKTNGPPHDATVHTAIRRLDTSYTWVRSDNAVTWRMERGRSRQSLTNFYKVSRYHIINIQRPDSNFRFKHFFKCYQSLASMISSETTTRAEQFVYQHNSNYIYSSKFNKARARFNALISYDPIEAVG